MTDSDLIAKLRSLPSAALEELLNLMGDSELTTPALAEESVLGRLSDPSRFPLSDRNG